MCFAANVNFATAAIIGAVGVATLRHVKQPRAVLFAAIPLFFALHQATEGFVWLGVHNIIRPDAKGHLVFLFILYAQGVLPFLMPLAVVLMEPSGPRRRVVVGLTMLGASLGVYVLYGLIANESVVKVVNHSLDYENPSTDRWWVALAYVVATCGALVASSHRVVRWFGVVNLVGGVATVAMLYWQFSRRKIDIARPNRQLDDLAAVA